MKPNTTLAMRNLIVQIRQALPFDMSSEQICAESCNGCSMKLLSFLETELDGWERRLLEGETPNFGDLNKLASTSRKIQQVLKKNGLCSEATDQT